MMRGVSTLGGGLGGAGGGLNGLFLFLNLSRFACLVVISQIWYAMVSSRAVVWV
jgi:hypothetical protein